MDDLAARMRADLEEIGRKWQDGIVKLVNEMPSATFATKTSPFASAA